MYQVRTKGTSAAVCMYQLRRNSPSRLFYRSYHVHFKHNPHSNLADLDLSPLLIWPVFVSASDHVRGLHRGYGDDTSNEVRACERAERGRVANVLLHRPACPKPPYQRWESSYKLLI